MQVDKQLKATTKNIERDRAFKKFEQLKAERFQPRVNKPMMSTCTTALPRGAQSPTRPECRDAQLALIG